MRPKRPKSAVVASSRASSDSNMGYRAFKCVYIDSSSHLGRNRPFIVLIDTQWTLPEVAGCARSAPDQDRRLVLGALEAKIITVELWNVFKTFTRQI